jgi:hypothetical protein
MKQADSIVARRRSLIATVLVGVTLLGVALLASSAAAEQRIEVAADQTVTLEGEFASLKSLVEDLCWRTGVDLVAFDAADRAVAGHYERMPLRDVLERLLRGESFTIGLAARPGSREVRVARLTVMGEYGQTGANRAHPQAPAGGQTGEFRVPPALMLAAFNAPPGPEQEAALRQLTERVANDPRELEKFLSTDPKVIAEEIGRYPRGPSLLAQLRAGQSDARVLAHLDAVLAILDH